ncbi:MAG: putative lipopolysaccharide heptosyltransferase [Chlamydiota bacterium]
MKRIIVRMPNWIGDLVMATPILADLRRAYPQAEITAMCRAPMCELLQEDPHIDELFCFSRSSPFSRRKERRNVIKKLKNGKYDVGILLTHSFSSAWWFWVGGVKRRIGYRSNMRSWLLTDPLSFPENLNRQHLVATYKQLLQPLDIALSSTPPCLYLKESEKEEARELLAEFKIPKGSTIVGINPGATYGSAKCWLKERFQEVAEKLLKDPTIHVVFFGDTSTAPLVREICSHLPSRTVNLAGKTSLRELTALISLCTLLLTNDSGPMHIADAVETPLIALFGSTSDTVTGPYRKGTVIHKHVSCSPCYERVCPIDFRCMREISASEVYDAIMNQLHPNKLRVR